MMRQYSEDETGVFISRITDKHVWLVFVYNGKPIYEQPMATVFRDHLSEAHQLDVDSGQVSQGFQPATAFAKLKLQRLVEGEIDIA
jgi:hypothetical protein